MPFAQTDTCRPTVRADVSTAFPRLSNTGGGPTSDTSAAESQPIGEAGMTRMDGVPDTGKRLVISPAASGPRGGVACLQLNRQAISDTTTRERTIVTSQARYDELAAIEQDSPAKVIGSSAPSARAVPPSG